MSDPDSLTITDELLSGARLRIDACRAELKSTLMDARGRYRAALAELESLGAGISEGARQPLASRLESLRRSQSLHRAAGELDGAITRLDAALACLDTAVETLEGSIGQSRPSREPPEMSLEAVAIQAQEEERYRLAREIHDGPAQILANVALQLEYIARLSTRDPARARDELSNIQKDLRLAVGEVRRFMYDLRPPALAQQGVGPAVESHCQRLAERFGIEITVDWRTSRTLPASHDVAVFRIVQESLQNVVKHAQATQVRVRAVEKDDFLEVSVADNGTGFDAARIHRLDPDRFGLAGMRARAHQIGGTLDVTSAPTQGTTITLRVPFAA